MSSASAPSIPPAAAFRPGPRTIWPPPCRLLLSRRMSRWPSTTSNRSASRSTRRHHPARSDHRSGGRSKGPLCRAGRRNRLGRRDTSHRCSLGPAAWSRDPDRAIHSPRVGQPGVGFRDLRLRRCRQHRLHRHRQLSLRRRLATQAVIDPGDLRDVHLRRFREHDGQDKQWSDADHPRG